MSTKANKKLTRLPVIPILQRIKKSHGPEFEESFSPPKAKERRRISTDRQSSHSHEPVDQADEEDQAADEEVANTVTGGDLSPLAMGSVDTGMDPRCDFCLLTASCNRNGVTEELLFCKDCQAKGKFLKSLFGPKFIM